MPSPFPGMDPYLGESWGDVHACLIVYTRDALVKALPASLRCRVERRVYEYEEGEDVEVTVSDVQIVERWPDGYRLAALEGASKPVILDAVPEPIAERFLEIRDKADNRLVTQIEYLGPANKRPGPSRRKYVEKQRAVCRSDANLVEIDLVRAGEHTVAVPFEHLEMIGCTPYVACVRRATVRHKAEVYPIPFDEPLTQPFVGPFRRLGRQRGHRLLRVVQIALVALVDRVDQRLQRQHRPSARAVRVPLLSARSSFSKSVRILSAARASGALPSTTRIVSAISFRRSCRESNFPTLLADSHHAAAFTQPEAQAREEITQNEMPPLRRVGLRKAPHWRVGL